MTNDTVLLISCIVQVILLIFVIIISGDLADKNND